MDRAKALELARHAVAAAAAAGADGAEAAVDADASIEVTLAKNDLDQVKVSEETTLGLRVLVGGRVGFATTNRAHGLEQLAAEAVAVARASPVDELACLPGAVAMAAAPDATHPSLERLTVADIARIATDHLRRVRAADPRVVVDMGEVSLHRGVRAVASTEGVGVAFASASVGGDLFGMAVEDGTPGSFSHDGDRVRALADLDPALTASFDRFVANCVGALRPRPGRSFRGPVLIPPWAVGEFLLSPLLTALSGTSVRVGRSPFGDQLGERVAAPGFTLRDGGAGLPGFALAPFDREGQPRRARTLIDDGVLRGLLFDSREGAAAGAGSTGNAVGGAASQPAVGLSSLSIDAGTVPSHALRAALPLGVLVTRFSGSTDPVSGDFSGVVKGGFLVEDGALTPIHETTVAGNVWSCLRQIDALSSDRLQLQGTRLLPWIRIPDLSITAA